ncbi:MAG: hypothetical protein GX621_00110 [Pirellulaceae bacterium]|nr:hypothetical protein [Pirellulaceae bacterium]
MTLRIAVFSSLVLLPFAGTTLGQGNQDWRSSPPAQGYGQPAAAQPGQPVVRQPQGQAVPMPMQPAWWPLPARDQQYLEQVLNIWEQHGDRIQVFETKFVLHRYAPDLATNSPTPVLQSEDKGILKYQKPDRGLYEIQGKQPEKWICDGKSYFQYHFGETKQIVQEVLPPEMQGGKALAEGPVPFVFGAKADRLKELYWIRPLLPTPSGKDDELWLEAWPRTQKGAADFRYVVIILSTKDMRPIAIERHASDGQNRTLPDGRVVMIGASHERFLFYDTVINPQNPLRILEGDPFKPRVERGWKIVVAQPPADHPSARQAGQQSGRR